MAQIFALKSIKYWCHFHMMVDLVKKLSAIGILILKMFKMIVWRICLRT